MKPSVLSGIRNREIGFIFQGFNLIPALTALENVELPLIYRGMPREERRRLAQEALVSVGLEKRMDHRPGEMSGGQQQRVATVSYTHLDVYKRQEITSGKITKYIPDTAATLKGTTGICYDFSSLFAACLLYTSRCV